MKLQDLNTVQRQEETEYGRYLDQLGQYNTDRNFDYSKWLDEYDMERDRIDTLRGLRNDEYNMFLGELDQFNTDRDFDYGQLLDEIGSQTAEREEEYQREQDAYDRAWDEDERTYQRGLDAYDRQVDAEKRAYDRARSQRDDDLEFAKLQAEFGDYDALRALGITPEDDSADEEGIPPSSGAAGEEEEGGYISAASADAQIEDQLKQLVSEGYDTGAIRALLARAKKSGLLSSDGYARLFEKYARGSAS